MKKRIALLIISFLCFIGITIAVSWAWFLNNELVTPDISGYSASAYFAGGDGSEEHPYEIATPKHLYNLAWLQYLGTFNKEGTGNTPEDGTGNFTQYHFVLNQDINMTGWALPPIGTTEYPFVGSFDGQGYSVQHLVTTNNLSDCGTKHPSSISSINNANIIGFFGVIGPITDRAEMANKELTVSSSANYFVNTYLENTTVKSNKSDTLIGIGVGYINGTVSDIGIIDSSLDLVSANPVSPYTTNISNYAVAGYATDDYVTQKVKSSTLIYNPSCDYATFTYKAQGDAAGWGGSMNFADMFDRFRYVKTSEYNGTDGKGSNFNYVYQEIIQTNGNSLTNTQNSSTQDTTFSNNGTNYLKVRRYKDEENPENGEYLTWYRYKTNGEVIDYNYVLGLYKDVYTIEESGSQKTGYKINDGNGHYLYYNQSTNTISSTDDVDLATIWLSTGSDLYAYNQEVYSTTIRYYLNGTTTLTSNLSTSSSTTWSWDSTYNTYKYTYGGNTYYLKFYNGNWCVTPLYKIGDGDGHYLCLSGTTITDTGTPALFEFSNPGTNPSGTISTLINGTRYYLRNNNGTLQLSTTNSNNTWTNTNGALTISNTDGTYYLDYDSGWKLSLVKYKLYNGSNYLYVDNLNISNTTNQNNATVWTYYNNKFYTTIGNDTYYLNFDNGATNKINLTADSTLATTNWSKDTYGYYYTYNNTKMYLQYSSGWKAATPVQYNQTRYYISYTTGGVTHYFSVSDDGEIYDVTDVSEATAWIFSNTGTYPSGYISTIKNGYTMYLYMGTGSNPSIYLDSSGRSFNNNNGRLYFTNSSWGTTYYNYLTYNNGWKGARSTSQNSATTLSFSTATYDYSSTYFCDISDPICDVVSISQSSSNHARTSVATYDLVSTKTSAISEFSYVPLNATTQSVVSQNNTGYIIGGSNSNTTPKGDYRVSQYKLVNIADSYSSGATSISNVYTIGSSGLGMIGNAYSAGSFAKYTASYNSLLDTLQKNSTYVYGLHFMDASISINKLVVAPKVLINKQVYPNYQMPEDCIDFRLASKGYINFFAGYYFPNNNSFFSLHEIRRDSNNNIIAINHISKIYKKNNDGSAAYVYEYVSADPTTGYLFSNDSNTAPSGYSVAFDKSWIESPSSYGVTTADYASNLFYFEVPVNSGEFALGSVSGGTGAYLLYLDIGANAQQIERTIVTQESVNTLETFSYVTGIAIVASKDDVIADPKNVAVAIISQGITGEVTFTKDDGVITVSKNLSSSYVGSDVTLKYNNVNITPVADNVEVITKDYVEYIDFNISNNEVAYTNIVRTKDAVTPKGGTTTTTTTWNYTITQPENSENTWALFDNNGDNVSDVTSITISPSTSTVIYDYNYMYGSAATVTEVMTIDTAVDNKNPKLTTDIANDYYVTGNSVTITTTEAFTVSIGTKNASYVLVINGHTKSANSTEDVSAS